MNSFSILPKIIGLEVLILRIPFPVLIIYIQTWFLYWSLTSGHSENKIIFKNKLKHQSTSVQVDVTTCLGKFDLVN